MVACQYGSMADNYPNNYCPVKETICGAFFRLPAIVLRNIPYGLFKLFKLRKAIQQITM